MYYIDYKEKETEREGGRGGGGGGGGGGAYRDGVLLDVKDFHINLHVLVGSLGSLVEQTML